MGEDVNTALHDTNILPSHCLTTITLSPPTHPSQVSIGVYLKIQLTCVQTPSAGDNRCEEGEGRARGGLLWGLPLY